MIGNKIIFLKYKCIYIMFLKLIVAAIYSNTESKLTLINSTFYDNVIYQKKIKFRKWNC